MSPDDPRHGTHAGYRAHQRAKSKPCTPCKTARRDYERDKYPDERPGPCTSCGATCRSKIGLCRDCQAAGGTQEAKPCSAGCGSLTSRSGGVCRWCAPEREPVVLTEDDLLLDGWWIRKGLTLKWVTAA